ncbi:MAG: LysM peptidoglycan-binding domain-containing protein [Treponema sp.]|nr:LysM peptidoglycan-binding domain-containing protein [Treponema sp.]
MTNDKEMTARFHKVNIRIFISCLYKFTVFFLLLFFINSLIWAQSDINRPLRTIPPVTPNYVLHAISHSSGFSLPIDDILPDGKPSNLISGFSILNSRVTSLLASNPSLLIPSNPRFDSPLPISMRAANSLITERALEQTLTRQFIDYYLTPNGMATLNAMMERGNIFLPFIREEVARRGLPPELVYLPIIESGFVITAVSRSGAVGLWQFMLNSISPYNMKVTDLMDERRDFIKSTKGALQKLEDEYNRLGDWELTLAAYNAGLAAVTRTVQSSGINDYWELSRRNLLRSETINFVPRLIAVSYILSQPRRFAINVWQEKFEWAAVPLERQVSVDIIAEETGISRELLRRLNAELTHGITPAGTGHLLKVPFSHLEIVNNTLKREDLQLIRFYYHVVRSGDTLWGLSRYYGTSLNMIEQHNPGISNRYLKIGETVIIPAFNEVTPPARPVVNQNFDGNHTVQQGESFWSISRLYGVDPQVLAETNGMRLDQILHIGRVLRVPIME